MGKMSWVFNKGKLQRIVNHNERWMKENEGWGMIRG
jgi:hypothetical protein